MWRDVTCIARRIDGHTVNTYVDGNGSVLRVTCVASDREDVLQIVEHRRCGAAVKIGRRVVPLDTLRVPEKAEKTKGK